MSDLKRRWMSLASTAAVVVAGLFSVGCGRSPAYEPEYPEQYYPAPPTAAELAAQQQARAQANADSREVLVGGDADEYSDTDPSALTEFKPALDGHGTWVQDSTYGTVWVPASSEVGTDFQPYVTAGHWTYSDSTDYVWVSDYEWGWAPFHYGRWVMLPSHGWSWIPGRRYAGAWVVWRTGPVGYGYVGWAPMGPSWYWYNGYAVGWGFGHYHYYDHYVYCPHNYVYHGSVSTYAVRGPAAREHYGRTQDYVAASPSVGGGGGGDRVLASPSVGSGRQPATPGVGSGTAAERVAANPAMATKGPRPDEMGLKGESVVAPPPNHHGLAKAQAFSTPKTAVPAGAAAPAHVRPSSGLVGTGNPGPQDRGPASSAFIPRSPMPSSHAPVATSPQYRSPSGATVSTPQPRYSAGARDMSPPPQSSPPAFSQTSPSFRPSSPSVSSPPPSFRSGASSMSPSPSFRSSSPSVSSPPPSFRSGASSMSPSPSFRSSSPSVSAPPSFRSGASSMSPSRPSSPSITSRPSSPSFSRPSVSPSGGGGTRATSVRRR